MGSMVPYDGILYPVIKSSELLLPETAWMNLKRNMLN